VVEQQIMFDDGRAARLQRIRATKKAQKKRSEYRGGAPPFGFTYDDDRRKLVPRPAQQKALRRIRKLHAEGMASRAIGADLAQRGIKVSHVTITKLIASAAAGRGAT
jgi:DNA invertase Pin-like site-specific DNA recombinase